LGHSIVQLLCLRSRSLIEAERGVPLRPFTRRNVLAHAGNYKQLQSETGLDLAAFLRLDVEILLTDPEDQYPASASQQGGAADSPDVKWAYTSLVKGEILLKLAFHTAKLAHQCMREASWSAVLQLLTYCRSRGALPLSLALVAEDFAGGHPLPHNGDAVPSGTVGASVKRLPPSPYAHRCYLEAYGLTLSYPGQNGRRNGSSADLGPAAGSHGASSSGAGGSWLGFLFSDTQHPGENDRTGVHSGTLDLPNLYCNTNASACVDMNCEPLRPDDSLLRVALNHSHPDSLLFGLSSEEEHFSQTSQVLRTLLHALSEMLEALCAPGPSSSSKVVPSAQNGAPSLFKASLTKTFRPVSLSRDDDDAALTGGLYLSLPAETQSSELSEAFPLQLLEAAPAGRWNNVRELDVVTVLEWATKIVLRDELHVQYFWPDLHGECGSLTLQLVQCVLRCGICERHRVYEACPGGKRGPACRAMPVLPGAVRGCCGQGSCSRGELLLTSGAASAPAAADVVAAAARGVAGHVAACFLRCGVEGAAADQRSAQRGGGQHFGPPGRGGSGAY
jgi:hypothetical protein